MCYNVFMHAKHRHISSDTLDWLITDPFSHLVRFDGHNAPSYENIYHEHRAAIKDNPKVVIYAGRPFLDLMFAMNAIPCMPGETVVCISTIRREPIPQCIYEEMDIIFDIDSDPRVLPTGEGKNRWHQYVGNIPDDVYKKLLAQHMLDTLCDTYYVVLFDDKPGRNRFTTSFEHIRGRNGILIQTLQIIFELAGCIDELSSKCDFSWYDLYDSYSCYESDDWKRNLCRKYSLSERDDIASDLLVDKAQDAFLVVQTMLLDGGLAGWNRTFNPPSPDAMKDYLVEHGAESAIDAVWSGVPIDDIFA